MTDLSDTEFIVQTARAVVAEIAPGELVSFPLMVEAYMQNPESLLARKASGKVGLGFGAGDVIVTWTPMVLLLLQQAVLQGGKDAVEEGTKDLLTGMFGRVRGLQRAKSKKPITPLPARGQDLSREELQVLRTFFIETALQQGVKETKARQIAECVIGKWVTRPERKGEQP